jgi:hypothetical protein
MKTIKCAVRIENNKPILFWYAVYTRGSSKFSVLECFTWAEGHSEACTEYMRSLPLCDEESARQAIARYNFNVLDSVDAPMMYCKRLARPRL